MFGVLIDGVLIGGVYALIGIGLTIIFGVTKIINFAHGDFFMFSLYGVLFAESYLGLNVYATAIVVVPGITLLSMAVFWITLKPILSGPYLNKLISTFGVSLIIQNVILFWLSPKVRVIELPSYVSKTIDVLGTRVTVGQIVAFSVALLITGILFWILKGTSGGRVIRAVSEDPAAASLLGVNSNLVYAVSFGIGTGCVGVAAVVIAPLYYATPLVGPIFTLIAFLVVIVGGLGSFMGALLGGIVIGLIESIGSYWLPGSYSQLLLYGLFGVILLVRPYGIFGESRL